MDGSGHSMKGVAQAVLLAFVGAWLYLAAQPCLAAMSSHDMEAHCDHCPDASAEKPACADAMGGDCTLPDSVTDHRTAKPDLTTVLPAVAGVPDARAGPASCATAHLQPDHTGPPLTERYCRYFE